MRPPFFVCACAAQMARARMRAQKKPAAKVCLPSVFILKTECVRSATGRLRA